MKECLEIPGALLGLHAAWRIGECSDADFASGKRSLLERAFALAESNDCGENEGGNDAEGGGCPPCDFPMAPDVPLAQFVRRERLGRTIYTVYADRIERHRQGRWTSSKRFRYFSEAREIPLRVTGPHDMETALLIMGAVFAAFFIVILPASLKTDAWMAWLTGGVLLAAVAGIGLALCVMRRRNPKLVYCDEERIHSPPGVLAIPEFSIPAAPSCYSARD